MSDARDFLRGSNVGDFDIVFLDPPFATDMLDELCRLLDEESILARGAQIYVEEDRDRPDVKFPSRWRVVKSKNTGNVRYSLVETESKG